MVNNGYPGLVGKSLLEVMWDELMVDIGSLIQEPDQVWMKGHAAGVAWCIAVLMHSPGAPNVEEIKAEAMERWEREHESVQA